MEEEHCAHVVPLPRRRLPPLLRPQLFRLGREVFGRRAVRHHVRAAGAVVWHLGAARLPRLLLWLSAQERRFPRARQPDTAPGARAGLVHAARLLHHRRRRAALRRRLHRALLHPFVHLAPPVLLCLRLPAAGLHHPHHNMRRNHRRHVLLPALRRGLPLVVALLPQLGLGGALLARLLVRLLLHAARHGRLRAVHGLLRLHVHRLAALQRHHRHHRFPRLLVVCAQDIRGCQGGLESGEPRRPRRDWELSPSLPSRSLPGGAARGWLAPCAAATGRAGPRIAAITRWDSARTTRFDAHFGGCRDGRGDGDANRTGKQVGMDGKTQAIGGPAGLEGQLLVIR
mmetsp:Transcript_42460/g.105740  ORF Transcript_42460/g.105740 Transcript_42460/m.105740 type:complete len:342 (+) Transcript_42460:1207-2232(+)